MSSRIRRGAAAVAVVLLVVAACVDLVGVTPPDGGPTGEEAYAVVSDPRHPVSVMLYAAVVLTALGLGVRRRGTAVTLGLVAAGLALLAALWCTAQSSTTLWDGVDAHGNPTGGMVEQSPTGWVTVLYGAAALQALAGVVGLRRP